MVKRYFVDVYIHEPVLFATSELENMRYGRPDATDTEVYEAVTLTNAHDFIVGFPEGYNTILGERGVTVSEGQKHGIAIARALIKYPSILIPDEATRINSIGTCNRTGQEVLKKWSELKIINVLSPSLIDGIDGEDFCTQKGHSRGTALWATNIGNERGQVLMSVLTEGQEEGLKKMIDRIRQECLCSSSKSSLCM
ncbi:ATP-binding cassette [Mactra antiquata]